MHLYLCFIEEISFIYNEMEFIPCKIMLQSFQQEIIPGIFGAINPFFRDFMQKIEIESLSRSIEKNVNISGEKSASNDHPTVLMQFSAENILFNLLQEVVSFKFNITKRDYD